MRLSDGRILFVYTHFTGGGADESSADLVARTSADEGRTWSDAVQVVPRGTAMNVMSASLLRLADGRIALFHLAKNSMSDCRLHMLSSTDEGATWHEPILCMPEAGCFVVNNDRVIQLKSGRLVVAAARHHFVADRDGPATGHGQAICFLSDDVGKTWRAGRTTLDAPQKSRAGLQEPAVVELRDARLLMLIRTDLGFQYQSISTDGDDTWSAAQPSPLASPLSPCSIKRVPKTGDLLVIWNDHRATLASLRNKRTPFSAAISTDEGKTWRPSTTLADNLGNDYCYTAMLFLDDHVLLAYDGLAGRPLVIASLPTDWLYH